MQKEKEIKCQIALRVKAGAMALATLLTALWVINYLKQNELKISNFSLQKTLSQLINI